MQFAAPPLSALYGLGVAWLWHRGGAARVAGAFAILGLVALLPYTLYSRLIA